jgi:carboxypeptidase C (cathepsin A)
MKNVSLFSCLTLGAYAADDAEKRA